MAVTFRKVEVQFLLFYILSKELFTMSLQRAKSLLFLTKNPSEKFVYLGFKLLLFIACLSTTG